MEKTDCSHTYRVIDGSDEICTMCAQVIGTVFEFPQEGSAIEPRPQGKHLPRYAKLKQDVLDCLAILHSDIDWLAEDIVEHYLKLASSEKRTNKGLLAFVTWTTLINNKCPRSPADVSYAYGVSTGEMQRAEKHHGIPHTPIRPSQLIHGIGDKLSLPFVLTTAARLCLEKLDHHMHKPETLITAVLVEIRRYLASRVLDMNAKNTLFQDELDVLKPLHLYKFLGSTHTAVQQARRLLDDDMKNCLLEAVNRLFDNDPSVQLFKMHCNNDKSVDSNNNETQ